MKSKYFTKEKRDKALKWLDEKWKKENRRCDICNDDEWSFAHELVTPKVFLGHKKTTSFVDFPHLLLTCNTCGNGKFFNAVLMDIVPNKVSKDS